MKKIEVSDEMYSKLIKLAEEMTTQDMRGTRMPHMFQIKEEYDQIVPEGYGDSTMAINYEGLEISDFKELKEHIQEILDDSGWSQDEIEDELSSEDWDEYVELLTEHTEETWSLIDSRKEQKLTNTFFTAKACQEHIDSNNHHYNKPTVYLSHAWRNPEMELVSEFLCNLVGKTNHK